MYLVCDMLFDAPGKEKGTVAIAAVRNTTLTHPTTKAGFRAEAAAHDGEARLGDLKFDHLTTRDGLAQDNVVATYPIVLVKGTRNQAAARAFIAFLLSAAGQSTLASYGFETA